MLRFLSIAALIGIPGLLHSQQNGPLADAGISQCEYPRSPQRSEKWTASKSGLAVAVEIRTSVAPTGTGRRCTTSWIVHSRGEDGFVSTIKVAERVDKPGEDRWSQENSFEVEAFSKDGKAVLLSQIEAQGDWDETTPIIVDLESRRHWRIRLYPLFKSLIPAGCYVIYRALKFTNKGSVLISAESTETDLDVGTMPCFATSLWELDYRNKRITRFNSPVH